MSEEDFPEPPYTRCNNCNNDFETSFDLIDHLLEDDEEFDPYYVLPNGTKFMLGSFFRFINGHADKPERIRHMAQSAYVTLFAAELGYAAIDEIVQDIVVTNATIDLDEELKKLLEGESNG